jgi:hypothetical protein
VRVVRFFSVVLPVVVALGAGMAEPAAATWVILAQDQYDCTDPILLPKPPAGPWVQSVQVCGPASHVHAIAEYQEPSHCCVSVVTPWAWVDSSPIVVHAVVDGTPTVATVPLPTGTAGTGGPVCLYTNNPFDPYGCLLVAAP